MRVFKEEQAFRQWWLIAILGVSLLGVSIPILIGYKNTGKVTSEFLGLGIVLLIILLFWVLRLHTKIDANGIRARFEPTGLFIKEFTWKDISKCYVRKYSPLTEYGGWGIRGLGKAKAYNVSGNIGIQIITKQNQKFLIGTRKGEEVQKVLSYYREKIKES